MTETKLFHIPARIADLGFSVSLPADWVSHALPDETIDFENPTAMVALAIVTHPAAAIVFSVGARPAYGDGVLLNWAHYLLQASELKPQAIGPEEVAGVPAQVGQASQQSDLGEMLVRFAFLEDGGRLINISLTAPEGLAGAVQEVWFDALASFQLAAPKGATPPAPASEESAPKVENGGDPEEMATYALADDAASLSPDEAINANLCDRGIGLVPRVVATDDASKTATVGAGAILAQFDLPYGWHVIDDGKRTLVFEPKGEVQISLNLIPLDGHDFQGVLDEIEAQMRRDYPAPEFMRLSEAPIEALGARNIKDGDEEIEQYHLLIPGPSADMALRARVTTVPQRNREAGNLAELILKSAVFGSFSEPKGAPDSDGPAWWQKAKALEADGDLEGAEKTIRQAVDHLGAFASIAQLYLERMVRLKEEGDAAGAADAFQRAESWIYSYAGGATSGGEGAALSLERDDFMAELKAAFEA